jgi:hypothetical protein
MAVTVDWDVVESVDDLDRVFKKALAKADDEAAEGEIRSQWSESKAQFWERRANAQALQVAKRDALDKYPLAKEFAEDVRGASAAEIEASAKRFHERMEKVTADADAAKAAAQKATDDAKASAQQQYGQPVGAGGGTPSRPALEDNEALKQRVMGRLQKGQGLQDSQGRMDSTRYQNLRFAEGVEASITNPSYRSFGRNAPDDKKITDDRTRRARPAG